VSELLSIALFLTSVVIYALKAGRNTWWFAATLTVLGLFVVLNITLYASDYFTGDGINDAVLYTLTNSLTGAGVGKYILPGVGLVARWCRIWRAGLGAAPSPPSSSSFRLQPAGAGSGAGLRGCQPGLPSNQRAGQIAVPRWRSRLCRLLQRAVEEHPNPKLNLVYIYGESLERTYFDNDAFPDLTPELGKLKTKASISATPPSCRYRLHHRRHGRFPVRYSAVCAV
jgi:phosphoglycerol transferase